MANQWTPSKIATFLFNLEAILALLNRGKHPDSDLPILEHIAQASADSAKAEAE
jgi:hypothetical protein